MEQLENALAKEAKSGRGLLTEPGKGRRKYQSELSALALLRKLKGNPALNLVGTVNTLRKALSAFVSCPRGRPKKLAPVEYGVRRKPR